MTLESKEQKKIIIIFYAGEQWGGGERPGRDQTTRPLLTSHQGEGTEIHSVLRDRRPSTAACPAFWAMGTKELK